MNSARMMRLTKNSPRVTANRFNPNEHADPVGDPIMELQNSYWEEPTRTTKGELESMIDMYGLLQKEDHKQFGRHPVRAQHDEIEATFQYTLSKSYQQAATDRQMDHSRREQVNAPEEPPSSFPMVMWLLDKSCKLSKGLVRWPWFSRFFGLVVILNSIELWLQSDSEWLSEDTELLLQSVFTALFVVELTLRTMAARASSAPVEKFLLFDLFLVLIAVVDLLVIRPNFDMKVDWRLFTHLRALRLVRGARLQGMKESTQDQRRRLMSTCFWRSCVTFALQFVVLLPILQLFAMIICSLAQSWETVDDEWREFKKMDGSMVILTEIAVQGHEWYSLLWGLIGDDDSSAQAAGVILLGFLCLVNFLLGPIFVAVFVQIVRSSTQDENDRHHGNTLSITSRQVEGLRRILQCIDLDDDQRVSHDEFIILRRYYANAIKFCGIKRNDLKKIWALVEPDETGEVPLDTFVLGYLNYIGFSGSVYSMCLQLGLKYVRRLMLVSGRHDAIDDVQERVANKLEGQEKWLRGFVEQQKQDLQAFDDCLARLDAMHRTIDVGIQEKDLAELEALYGASDENALCISNIRRMVLETEVAETTLAVAEWAQSAGVDVESILGYTPRRREDGDAEAAPRKDGDAEAAPRDDGDAEATRREGSDASVTV